MNKIKMILRIYRDGEQVNEIKSTSQAVIYKEIAKIYRQKVDKLADCVKIVTGLCELQRAAVYTHFDDYTGKQIKYVYKYTFDGVQL